MNQTSPFMLLRAYIGCSVPPISQRWLAAQIGAAASALGRYLEAGKGLGQDKIDGIFDVLGLTTNLVGTPLPEPETAVVLSDGDDAQALLQAIRFTPSSTTPVFDEANRRIGTLVFIPSTNSAIVFLGDDVPKAMQSLLGIEVDREEERDRGAVVSAAVARRWCAGRVSYKQALRLSEGDPLADVRPESVAWQLIDEIRHPELPPAARLLTELHVNNISPLAALDVVRKDLGAKTAL